MGEWTEQGTYRQAVQDKLDAMQGTLNAILVQTTATNGRLRKAEVDIGRLQVGYGIGAALALAVVAWVLTKV